MAGQGHVCRAVETAVGRVSLWLKRGQEARQAHRPGPRTQAFIGHWIFRPPVGCHGNAPATQMTRSCAVFVTAGKAGRAIEDVDP